jgi:hypothetical protein
MVGPGYVICFSGVVDSDPHGSTKKV